MYLYLYKRNKKIENFTFIEMSGYGGFAFVAEDDDSDNDDLAIDLTDDDGYMDALNINSGWASYVVASFLQHYENPCDLVDKQQMLDYIDHDVKDGHLKYGLDVYVSELHDWLYCKAFIEQCRDRYMNEKQRMLDELYECMTCDCLEGSCQQRAFEERQRDIIIPEEAAKKVAHQWLDEQVRKDNVSSARYTTIKKKRMMILIQYLSLNNLH